MSDYKKYTFKGEVLRFDQVIEWNWQATTVAPSERKAYSNLTYRYKEENDFAPYTNIILDGVMTCDE